MPGVSRGRRAGPLLARIPRPILIRGERGTGKELRARFVHAASPRRDRPYFIVNCGAFQDELLVSHLFGHEKGAFTGAPERRTGVFEEADGGTLFLDEIANLSRNAQARLHRVVEYQTFQRVGGTSEIEVDVRVIPATNADLGGARPGARAFRPAPHHEGPDREPGVAREPLTERASVSGQHSRDRSGSCARRRAHDRLHPVHQPRSSGLDYLSRRRACNFVVSDVNSPVASV